MSMGRSFGAVLRSHRERLGLTQDQLAGRARVGARTIRELEADRVRRPHGDSIRLLSHALGLDPAESQAFAAAAQRRRPAGAPRLPVPPELRGPPTILLGRERELADVCRLLRRPSVRLLTLTGAPGAGKTRLALEVATGAMDDHQDGVVVVALGSLTDPVQVMPAIRQALGLAEAADRPALEIVAAHCRGRHLLLVLDNLEHVLAAASELVELLDRCPELRMLATSRTAARVRVEHELAVPPLRSVPSVALFVERAAAARPSFRLTAENASSVAAICRRLDGLPLALELAAPWVRLLTPREILERLDRQLELLVDGPRDLPERQRTMRTTLAWSCELLAAEPRALLRRLSVFRGGAPLDALDRVCQASGALRGGVLPHLAVLVDHGLVGRHEASGGEPRVTMLESVREYGAELLAAAGEEDATALARLEHCASLAALADRELRTGAQASWLERLRRELDNIRASLGWAVERGERDAGLRLAGMWSFWELGGHRREGLSWLSRLLASEAPAGPRVLAKGLQAAGFLSWRVGSHEQSVAYLCESRAIFEELGDPLGVAEATRGLGNAVGARGDHGEAITLLQDAARRLRDLDERPLLAAALTSLGVYLSREGHRRRATTVYEESLALQRDLDDALGMALVLTNLGHQAQIAGDLGLAQTRLEEAVAAGRRLDAPFHLAAALANLGDVFRERDEVGAASDCYREAVALFAELGDHPGVATCVRCLAWAAWTEGRPAPAARLYGAAETLCPAAVAYDPDDHALHERVRRALREQLGVEAFAAAHEAGGRLSADEAAAEASA
jgi:predicted ATPase